MRCLEVAFIGSGAVAQMGYLPAARTIPNMQVGWLVDSDTKRASQSARRFKIANYTGDYKEVFDKVDAVVVATPPGLHASITRECLVHGLHVLCEKPLTSSAREARELVRVASDSGVHFAVSSNRRFSASSRLLERLLDTGFLGALDSFEIEEGHPWRWPVQSGYRFDKDLTGGGVLAEFGPHVLDSILWWLGNNVEVIEYKDDNFGGVEANAWIELTVEHNSTKIHGSVELSNTRDLRNVVGISGERGSVEAPIQGGESVILYLNSIKESGVEIRLTERREYANTWIEQIAAQLSAFVESIIQNDPTYVPASEAIPVMEIIESCYGKRKTILHPWEDRWFKLGEKQEWVSKKPGF